MLSMEYFIEYALIDNLLVDYLLLKESATILKARIKRRALLLAAFTGAAFATVFPLLKISALPSFALKMLCAALMCLISSKHGSFRKYLLFFNVFLLCTFVLGGVTTGILYLLGINDVKGAYYQAKAVPVGAAIFASYIVFTIIRRFAKKIAEKAVAVCGLIDCEIAVGGERFAVKAFYDSGNLLKDKRTGLPIIVADRNVFLRISRQRVPARHDEIAVVSAGGRFRLGTYRIDYIIVKYNGKTTVKDAVIAVSERPSGIAGADILIGKDLIGELI